LRVPPGFIITTKTCMDFFESGGKFPEGLWEEVIDKVSDVEKKTGKKFGDPNNPLLFSVRSGAPVSMPGMMDTVLNLGMNDEVAHGFSKLIKNERFVYDAYRRFITMFADVVMGAERKIFDEIYEAEKKKEKVKTDPELSAAGLKIVVETQKKLYLKEVGTEFPMDPYQQLKMSIAAVFNSWNTPRAITYRKIEGIPDAMGTACNIQTMVFGNFGDDSGSGVLFTRDPSNGEKNVVGEILFNAQGEDVVAGLRTPLDLNDLKKQNQVIHKELLGIVEKLEQHYKDIQDVEFTIERGVLYMLQTRSAKRTAKAAVKCAYDMVNEKLITDKEAVLRVEPRQIEFLLHKSIDPESGKKALTKGLPASPGAAIGQVVFIPKEAEEWKAAGKKVILVRPETTPEDIAGMVAAEGVLTSRGGMTSHAAIVARGIGKPAIVGCESLHIDLEKEQFSVGDILIKKGDVIAIDGLTAEIFEGEVPLVEPKISGEVEIILNWADKYRRLGIWANANDEADATKANMNGAQGIGLART
ncbi:pyruvate, phosphate dikinase, partial [Candidatus Bathyarchaeota archaeon]|nr:pyruvate, phosphate dikinase [Candidatus Bathyarchaeota archaeon]